MQVRLLLCFLVLAGPAWAQVTITQNDMPRSGDTLRYSDASPVLFSLPVATGTGQTWDYSTLTPQSQGVAQYKSATSLSVVYSLFFGFSAYGRLVADTISAGGIQATDVYNFYRRSAANFSVVGAGINISGLTIPSNYSDVDELYSFPLTYGRRDSTTFRVLYTVPSLGSLTQAGTRTNTVIGEGNITTPFGTYPSILLRTVERREDTIRATQLPIPIGFSSVNITYQWLAVGQRLPILEVQAQEIFGAEQVTSVTYRDIRRIITLPAPTPNFLSLSRQVNVGDSVFFFNLTTPPGGNRYLWSLAPIAGWQFAAGTSASTTNPVVRFSQAGLYSVSLQASNATNSADTTQPDYIEVQDPNATRPAALPGALLWPSPARDRLQVYLPPTQPKPPHLLAASTDGRLVRLPLSAQGQVQVYALPAGVYRVYLPSGPLVGSFVRE